MSILNRGLYYELARQGSIRRLVSEEEIKTAIFTPPETTRAFFRGRSVARFNDQIASIQWDEIVFANGALSRRVGLAGSFRRRASRRAQSSRAQRQRLLRIHPRRQRRRLKASVKVMKQR